MTCFKHCYFNECHVANLRGESKNMHSINFTTICLNGFLPNEQYNSDEKDKSITFTSFSNIIIVVNNNNTKNSVSHNSGGQQIISNFIAYLKYSTFSNIIGESILHISLKNDKSSIEYINILNNSAILKFHGSVIFFCKNCFWPFCFYK